MKIGTEGIDMWPYPPKWAKGLAIPQSKSLLQFLWCPVEMTAQLQRTHGRPEITKSQEKKRKQVKWPHSIGTQLHSPLVLLKEKEEEKTNKDWLVSLVRYSSRAQFLFGCQRSFWPRYFLPNEKEMSFVPTMSEQPLRWGIGPLLHTD